VNEADHSPPSSGEVKNEWSFTCRPQYVFFACAGTNKCVWYNHVLVNVLLGLLGLKVSQLNSLLSCLFRVAGKVSFAKADIFGLMQRNVESTKHKLFAYLSNAFLYQFLYEPNSSDRSKPKNTSNRCLYRNLVLSWFFVKIYG
jgi:hypothetical protein